MTAQGMFTEFMSMLGEVFSGFFVDKYSWLYICVFCAAACGVITAIVRWFTRA